jgi:hypothetical protein
MTDIREAQIIAAGLKAGRETFGIKQQTAAARLILSDVGVDGSDLETALLELAMVFNASQLRQKLEAMGVIERTVSDATKAKAAAILKTLQG